MAELFGFLRPACIPAHGKGLGKQLLHAALKAAPALQIDTVPGFVFGHNAPGLRLFHDAGFEVWETLPKVAVLDGIERDLVILGKRLAEFDTRPQVS